MENKENLLLQLKQIIRQLGEIASQQNTSSPATAWQNNHRLHCLDQQKATILQKLNKA